MLRIEPREGREGGAQAEPETGWLHAEADVILALGLPQGE